VNVVCWQSVPVKSALIRVASAVPRQADIRSGDAVRESRQRLFPRCSHAGVTREETFRE
jgi:hypothetical protein